MSASAKPESTPEPCGELGCLLFDSPEEALSAILAERPQVLAVGESHAPKGSEGVSSTTKRFTEAFLPLIGDKASDLILEIWVPDPKCNKEQVAKVDKEAKEVTKNQAATNQNEFVTLGKKAESLGIRPHVLVPSCDEYDKIVKAGPDSIVAMLELITRHTADLAEKILARNKKTGVDKIVLTYGGALHNDLSPRAGRESWSFGPTLSEHTGKRYIELDLIAPEFIQDSESWRALPWYSHFDREAHPKKTTLFQPEKGSYVLIFPRS